jgi:hypothetical protein
VSRTSSVASRASLLSGIVTPEIDVVSIVFVVVADILGSPLNSTVEWFRTETLRRGYVNLGHAEKSDRFRVTLHGPTRNRKDYEKTAMNL